ncbi:rodlin [Streptomyces sp. NPDC056638]|uniref:rodlin n=1 Tax=Streptomyces sp. NPDC056638 TaxID=3345887 RepID=UPI0036CA7580
MIKRVLAVGAVAASILGLGATQAMAIGDDNGTTSVNGNGASRSFGNSETRGDGSPQSGLAQGSLNKPCIGLPARADEPLSHIQSGIPVLSGHGAGKS